MPAFVIVQSGFNRTGETEAILCAPNPATGVPDRRTAVPVRVRLVSEQVLSVDDERREIVSSVGQNGTTTFLINGSIKSIRNRERRVALARASGFLQQLTSSLMPLRAESADPESVAENLQHLFDWITRERERATTAPKGSRDDAR